MYISSKVKIHVFYVQARRILCEYCQQPFSYLIHGKMTFRWSDWWTPSFKSLEAKALAAGVKSLEQVAMKDLVGESLCPHCKCYQSWMVKNSREGVHGCGCLLVALPLMGLLLVNKKIRWDDWRFYVAIVLIMAVAYSFGFVCRLLGMTRGPHVNRSSPLSKTDFELVEHLTNSSQITQSPLTAWYLDATKRKPRKDETVLDLGVLDQTSKALLPEAFSTKAALQRLHNKWSEKQVS